MARFAFATLPRRGIVAVTGPDARTLLQGLVSNDVLKVAPRRAVYAALLTPQGRYLHDFLMAELGDRLVLDVEAARQADLVRRLTLYRLRANVQFAAVEAGLAVAACWGDGALAAFGLPAEPGAAVPLNGGVAMVDPRDARLGVRVIAPADRMAERLPGRGGVAGDPADYEKLRLLLGVPDGSRDLPVEQALLMENGFERLHGVDFGKGCYVGQEITARMKHRGLTKKRLVPVKVAGPLPAAGTPILHDGQEVGEMRSGLDDVALALLRVDVLEHHGRLVADGADVTPLR